MKYCVGCIYWEFTSGEHFWQSDMSGGGSHSRQECLKGHWYAPGDETTQPDLERYLEMAETCSDFNERPAHRSNNQPGGDQS